MFTVMFVLLMCVYNGTAPGGCRHVAFSFTIGLCNIQTFQLFVSVNCVWK